MNDFELSKLLADCKANKRAAQELLYKSFYGYGMSVCLRYTSNKEEAQEILNDGFVKVYTRLEQYQANSNFKAWFRRILINACIDYFRQKQRKVELTFTEQYIEPSIEPDYYNQLSYDELIYFVQELSPVYRMVFNLYAVEGYSHEEIGQMLNISEGTSKSNLSRAKGNLREMITNHHKAMKF